MPSVKWQEASRVKDTRNIVYINNIYLDLELKIHYINLIKHVGDFVVSPQRRLLSMHVQTILYLNATYVQETKIY